MRTGYRALAGLALLAGLVGCSGLTQVQDTLSRFDEGAHAAAVAQMSFFRAARTAECDAQFYGAAYDYAVGNAPAIDMRGTCTPQRLTDAQLAIRQDLMNAITLYADQLQALATTDDNKKLDSNAQALAGKINGLAKSGGLRDASIAGGVEAAVIGLTGMALDNTRFNDIRGAATAEQDNLATVLATLKRENVTMAAGIDSSLGTIRAEIATVLAKTKERAGPSVFFDVARARGLLQRANPFGVSASAGMTDSGPAPDSVAARLNATLESLTVANHAIATAGTGGIVAAVNDLVARAREAQGLDSALNP